MLRTHVDSVEKLDVVIALRRASERTASLVVLMREVGLPAGVTRRLVGELESSGLIVLDSHGTARLSPARRSDGEAIEALLEQHVISRVAILDALMGTT